MNNDPLQKHSWNVTPREAIDIQKQLASRINTSPFDGKIQYIAGADISLNRFSDIAYAGIIVLSYETLQPAAYACVQSKITFPYIPGLLSFREIPALVEVWEKLKKEHPNKIPDILVMDGQGIAHPRGMGIATHLGMVLDIPTIGCAKSLLYGVHGELTEKAGSISYLHNKHDHEKIIGALLRTKEKTKPVIVSPGNKIDLAQSIDILKYASRGYRIPEPTRLAHNLVNQFRLGEIE